MAKDIIVWCIEAPKSNFLKEVIIHNNGNRLIFTDDWYDNPMKFGMRSQAEKFKKDNGLIWLEITDHMIMVNNSTQ